jgi:signal transduction histidine kinase/CheY-like chemotaxis protein
MRDALFGQIANYVIPLLPKKFRRGRLPYVLFLGLFMIVVMYAFSHLSDYPENSHLPIIFGTSVVIALVSINFGVNYIFVVHVILTIATAFLIYLSIHSGGIYSPRMAWMTVIPFAPYYVHNRRAGYVWLVVVMLIELLMIYLTAKGIYVKPLEQGSAQSLHSLMTYSFVMLVVMVVPFLYDNLYQQAYFTSKHRNKELQLKQDELMRTLRIREYFIANVSHELRTPMNAILGFNAMLLDRVQGDEEALKILNHTRQSADHLLTVINDVLDYSQLQAGKLKIHFEVFSLRETIEAAFSLFTPRIESMRLKYRLQLAENVPQWVNTDRHRLMQVLVNLLGNAIKFTHEGRVTFRVQPDPQGVIFEILDTGIGIPDHQQPRIFERFLQAGTDTQARYGGNGLGLSITQRLVELMGGQIGFESKEGVGSRFWFVLPLKEEVAPRKAVQGTLMGGISSDENFSFLIADDHPVNRLLVRQILKTKWKNAQLVEVDDGRKVMQALQGKTFDAILMDMVMPGMDGIEATQYIRQTLSQEGARVPVLGLTANVNPEDLDRFTKAGVDAVVLKPFDPVKLCQQVELLIKARRSSQDS